MNNFELYNPTKIIFGKDCIDHVPNEIHWKRAMVIIGTSSVKDNGFYARVISLLNMTGLNHVTFQGVESNPTSELADKAIAIAKQFKAEVIIALGGGSVIDTAKAVSVGYFAEHSVWDFYTGKAIATRALPVLCILTLAACGTENNNFSYLQNDCQGIKKGFSSFHLYPKVSFLDPSITFTVDAKSTAYGISNLIAHSLEQYFANGHSPLSDYYTCSIIKLAVKYGKRVLEEPGDYETRANIMWLSTNSLNGLLIAGKLKADWGCHGIEQTLNILYNIQHGAGLSIVYPAWLKYFKHKITDKISFLAREVFDINDPDPVKASELFIIELENFYRCINCPTLLSDLNILPSEKEKIIENLILNKVTGQAYRLRTPEYEEILDYMW